MQNWQSVGAVCVLALLIIFGLVLIPSNAMEAKETSASEFFRIHIRANSNLEDEQRVKYEVKDAVVNVLTPILATAENKRAAMIYIGDNLGLIEQTAQGVLKAHGQAYGVCAEVKKESFPTRAYGDVVLGSGEYDSLILNLGTGSGDNWWCVVYPPLCFVGSEAGLSGGNVVYQSKLLEIIKSFFGR